MAKANSWKSAARKRVVARAKEYEKSLKEYGSGAGAVFDRNLSYSTAGTAKESIDRLAKIAKAGPVKSSTARSQGMRAAATTLAERKRKKK